MMKKERDRRARIQALKKQRWNYVSADEISVRDQAYREAVCQYPDATPEEQYARGFANALQKKRICIPEDDLLAGYLFQYAYNVNFPMKVSEAFDPAGRAKFQMDFRREVEETKMWIKGTPEEDQMLEEFADAAEVWLVKHWHSGHTLAGYEMLLKKGFAGLQKEVEAELLADLTEQETDTLNAFRIVLDACQKYVGRYRKEAERRLNECTKESTFSDSFGDRKKCLLRMWDALTKIETGVPETFFEALQLLTLANEMMYCENIPSGISLGRIDQYLQAFYERDMVQGRLTREEAGMLLDVFWLKCSCQKKAYQNVTLGGCDAEGKCAVNDLTYLCLETVGRLKVDQPSVNYRWTDDQPEEAWAAVLALIRKGMGFPAILYDPCCMEAQMKCGVSREDVWNYGFVGCVEMAIPGKENALTELARLNLPKLLDVILHEGKDPYSGKTFELKHPKILTEAESYEDLEQAFLEELEHWIRKMTRVLNRVEALYEKCYPLPYLSVLTEDCVRKKRDIMNGGALYESVGLNLCGLATVTDSLAAMRDVIWSQKRTDLRGFVQMLDRDFQGVEEIPRYVSNRAPKYGNDLEADEIARKIQKRAAEQIRKEKNQWGGSYRLGLYSVEDHAIMGIYTGTTGDGRLRGESLSNSAGASQGKDTHGPTALINSVTGFPMVEAGNGMVLDIKLTPSLLEEETGQRALKSLIETYFRKGGMEIQVSVVSGEVLRDAQKHPENYADLIVRVSGFSAYFCSLRKATQDEIIKRTEYTKG